MSISTAYADHGYHEGRWSGGCWGCGAWILGAAIATDIAITQSQQPYYAPTPVYVQPVYAQPVPQTVYVQAPPAPAQVPTWYFCKSANSYYPYVPSCPEGWQPVAAQPIR